MNKKRLANYVLYAIGEIILVVIGILIAVAINNWNEGRKEDKRLTTYLKDYRNDLLFDTLVVGRNIKLLDEKKKAFDLVLSDSLNKEVLFANPLTFSLTTTHSPFKLQNKGYNELKNFADRDNNLVDSLVNTIIANHAAYDDLIEQTQSRINNDIDDNLSYLKNNKKWVADLLTGNLTDEVIDYFLSKEYRNRAALHYVLAYGNLYQFLKRYQTYAEDMILQIDKRLAEDSEQEEVITPKEEDNIKEGKKNTI